MPVDKLIAMAIRIVAAAAIVALLLLAREDAGRWSGSERRATAAALARDTLEAAADTTRTVHMDAAPVGDSLRVVERRAIQAEQKAGALDRTLRTERLVHDQLQVRIATLERQLRSDSAVLDSTDDARSARFDLRDAPYTIGADVTLPRPPRPGAMRLHVELDTLGLALSISCGEPNEFGVRPAMARVAAPAWATVRLTRVEQAPSICATSTRTRETGLVASLRRAAERLSVTVGYGATRAASGTVVAGPGAMIGMRVWP